MKVNHGGRMENSLRSSVECVPEVAVGVAGRARPRSIVDGGFRRGTDIFKALALGATAVGVGRPYIFGLAAFGQAGVETALDILDSELRMVMRQAGTPASGASRRLTCAIAECRLGRSRTGGSTCTAARWDRVHRGLERSAKSASARGPSLRSGCGARQRRPWSSTPSVRSGRWGPRRRGENGLRLPIRPEAGLGSERPKRTTASNDITRFHTPPNRIGLQRVQARLPQRCAQPSKVEQCPVCYGGGAKWP